MGLEEVELDIKKRIESKVDAIKNAAEKEAAQILDNSKTRVRELKQQRDLEIQKLEAELKNRETAAANLSARKLKMDAKKEAIESVYLRIKEKLTALEQNKREGILSALIGEAVHELHGAKHVFCNSSDRDLAEKIAKKNGLLISGTIDCEGGVVVENSDHTVRVDYTYEMLLEIFRKESLKDISEQLFGK
ncbi:TPA: hypothetical protein H1016_01625 [archaeon]|uniref:A-type ATP synthase subunit E n=1 Tax=Candidatus Naiadarchaeum limnaeum TaxID=2756139 RepID=A0A832XLR3_9ARCH|nr:hypothetical protein [Candidatus Naiadarchaeum limnaeum]